MMGLGTLLRQKAEKPVREDDPTADNVETFRRRWNVMTERLEKKSTETKVVLKMTCTLIFSSS
jgi:hypothetical protein